MKKIRAAALLLGIVPLCACTAISPDKAKEKLEGEGYSVKIMGESEYEKSSFADTALYWSPSMDYFLSAEDGEKTNYLFAWYFMSNNAASNWNDLNSPWFNDIKVEGNVSLTSGMKNNVVWVGTNAAAGVVGFNSLF